LTHRFKITPEKIASHVRNDRPLESAWPNFDERLEAMRDTETPGDWVTLQAAAYHFQVEIRVFTDSTKNSLPAAIDIIPGQAKPRGRIYLGYSADDMIFRPIEALSPGDEQDNDIPLVPLVNEEEEEDDDDDDDDDDSVEEESVVEETWVRCRQCGRIR
jgi:hypothetical protein